MANSDPRLIRRWHESPNAVVLATALSQRMQELAREALGSRGYALIGLAGGSTPMAAYADFANAQLPWEKMKLALIDERYVPLTDSQSNEANIAAAFAEVKARLGAWQGLYWDSDDIASCAMAADKAMQTFGLPFDVTIIGMGSDGHIASLFAESPDYVAAIDPDTAQTIVPIRFPATEGKTDRLSMSFRALLKTRHILICIAGDEKRRVLQHSMDGSARHYAVARFLAVYNGPIDIYWSPL